MLIVSKRGLIPIPHSQEIDKDCESHNNKNYYDVQLIKSSDFQNTSQRMHSYEENVTNYWNEREVGQVISESMIREEGLLTLLDRALTVWSKTKHEHCVITTRDTWTFQTE